MTNAPRREPDSKLPKAITEAIARDEETWAEYVVAFSREAFIQHNEANARLEAAILKYAQEQYEEGYKIGMNDGWQGAMEAEHGEGELPI